MVIAIIALLVALLMPSLREAKELTRRTICMANLHHLGLAVFAYGSEFDSFPPPQFGTQITDPPSPAYRGEQYLGDWSSRILGPHVYDHGRGTYMKMTHAWSPYAWSGRFLFVTPWWQAMASFVSDPKLLLCPSAPYGRDVTNFNNWNGYNTYQWYGWTFCNKNLGYYAGITRGEKRLTYADDLLMSDIVHETFWQVHRIDVNHPNDSGDFADGSNHLYVDGSVIWVAGDDLEPSKYVRAIYLHADWPNQ